MGLMPGPGVKAFRGLIVEAGEALGDTPDRCPGCDRSTTEVEVSWSRLDPRWLCDDCRRPTATSPPVVATPIPVPDAPVAAAPAVAGNPYAWCGEGP